MSVAQNKVLAQRLITAYNTADESVLEELVSMSYIQHSPGVPPGRDAMFVFFKTFLAAFPDGRFEVEDILAEDDKVLIRWTCSGTQIGAWMGMPPTGKQVAFMGMDLWRFADSQLVEAWFLADTLGMFQQLGRMPGAIRSAQRPS